MTLHNRFRGKGINIALITLLILGTGIYSCFAQEQIIEGGDGTTGKVVKNSQNSIIHLASNLNLSAKASPLNPSVNSPFAELKPAIALHGNRLYFSRSHHPHNTAGVEDKEDIWYADIDKSNNNAMSEPKRLDGILNNSGPNFISGISVTGDTIMLGNQYSKKGKMRAGLSYSVNEESGWSAPKTIDIRNDYNLSEHGSAFVSKKAAVIISAIQREETYGDRDLYVSFWVGGEATEPINMGRVINSNLEESSPYLACDGKTIYFASKGHHGYGGYDIYLSHRLDETWTNWSEPENLGPVVNGPKDEEFFCITHCKKFAYFSKQVSDINTDLYKIPMTELFGPAKALFR